MGFQEVSGLGELGETQRQHGDSLCLYSEQEFECFPFSLGVSPLIVHILGRVNSQMSHKETKKFVLCAAEDVREGGCSPAD